MIWMARSCASVEPVLLQIIRAWVHVSQPRITQVANTGKGAKIDVHRTRGYCLKLTASITPLGRLGLMSGASVLVVVDVTVVDVDVVVMVVVLVPSKSGKIRELEVDQTYAALEVDTSSVASSTARMDDQVVVN